jgi:DNA-binding transcriptional MerR regulator
VDEEIKDPNEEIVELKSSAEGDSGAVTLKDIDVDAIGIDVEIKTPKIEYELEGQDLVEDFEAIPDKMAFKIGEVAKIVDVKQYVLRYWETEFDLLKPKKSRNNQRMYSRKDVETALMIKKLLHQERFSIEGARKVLKRFKKEVKSERDWHTLGRIYNDACNEIKGLIGEIRKSKAFFLD